MDLCPQLRHNYRKPELSDLLLHEEENGEEHCRGRGHWPWHLHPTPNHPSTFLAQKLPPILPKMAEDKGQLAWVDDTVVANWLKGGESSWPRVCVWTWEVGARVEWFQRLWELDKNMSEWCSLRFSVTDGGNKGPHKAHCTHVLQIWQYHPPLINKVQSSLSADTQSAWSVHIKKL